MKILFVYWQCNAQEDLHLTQDKWPLIHINQVHPDLVVATTVTEPVATAISIIAIAAVVIAAPDLQVIVCVAANRGTASSSWHMFYIGIANLVWYLWHLPLHARGSLWRRRGRRQITANIGLFVVSIECNKYVAVISSFTFLACVRLASWWTRTGCFRSLHEQDNRNESKSNRCLHTAGALDFGLSDVLGICPKMRLWLWCQESFRGILLNL